MRVIATHEFIGFRAKAANYLVPKLEGEQQVWITRMIRHIDQPPAHCAGYPFF